MKFHWGVRIFILYGIFIAGIVSMVIYFMGQDVDLVSKEYYSDEIKYQDKIDKLKRTQALKEVVKFAPAGERLTIVFPKTLKENITGEILFFCPADRKNDFRIPIQAGAGLVKTVDFHEKRKGLWKLEMNWKSGGVEYINEETVNIYQQ